MFHLKQYLSRDYLKEYFKVSKKYLLVSLIFAIIITTLGALSVSIGALPDDIAYQYDEVVDEGYADGNYDLYDDASYDDKYNIYDDIGYEGISSEDVENIQPPQDNTSDNEDNDLDALSLFIHNFSIDASVLISGLFLSIYGIMVSAYNYIIIGATFATTDPILILLFVVPHGIFEIPSSIFALAGALMLTHFTINMAKAALSKNNTMKDEYHNNSCYLLEAYIVTFIICFILLSVAAFIEGNITEPLGYLGLFMLGIL